MPNYIPKVDSSFFGGFTSVDNIVESYIGLSYAARTGTGGYGR